MGAGDQGSRVKSFAASANGHVGIVVLFDSSISVWDLETMQVRRACLSVQMCSLLNCTALLMLVCGHLLGSSVCCDNLGSGGLSQVKCVLQRRGERRRGARAQRRRQRGSADGRRVARGHAVQGLHSARLGPVHRHLPPRAAGCATLSAHEADRLEPRMHKCIYRPP